MSAYNIIVNDVKKTENRVLCLARIDNYQNMLKRVSIGESIRTDPFQLNFRKSIGSSSWILIFYPNGQYIQSSNSAVVESGQASMYLKMVHCEHKSDSLPMAIKFFFKSPYCDVMDEFSSTKYATLSYRNLNERWIGPFHMAPTEKLYSNRCKNLFLNDSLTLGCELLDTTFRPCMSPPMIRSKENVHTTGRSYSDGRRSINVEWQSDTFRHCVPVLQSRENRNTASSMKIGVKLDDVKGLLRNSSNVEFDFNETTRPQTVSRVCSKVDPRLAATSNAEINIEVFKEGKNQKKMPMQESSSISRSDPVKNKENEHFCKCRNPDEMISKETQTWSDILRSRSENAEKKRWRSVGADNATHSPSCCHVKAKVEFFEQLSKD